MFKPANTVNELRTAIEHADFIVTNSLREKQGGYLGEIDSPVSSPSQHSSQLWVDPGRPPARTFKIDFQEFVQRADAVLFHAQPLKV
jgi:hypothetical protein